MGRKPKVVQRQTSKNSSLSKAKKFATKKGNKNSPAKTRLNEERTINNNNFKNVRNKKKLKNAQKNPEEVVGSENIQHAKKRKRKDTNNSNRTNKTKKPDKQDEATSPPPKKKRVRQKKIRTGGEETEEGGPPAKIAPNAGKFLLINLIRTVMNKNQKSMHVDKLKNKVLKRYCQTKDTTEGPKLDKDFQQALKVTMGVEVVGDQVRMVNR